MPNNFVVIDHTKEVIEAKNMAVQRALEIIGGSIERYAKEECPVGKPETTGIPGYIGGTLRNSITYATAMTDGHTVTVEKGKADPFDPSGLHGGHEDGVKNSEENSVIVGTNVFYAPYVEFGTSRKYPKPFLKPALFNHLKEYRSILKRELEKG